MPAPVPPGAPNLTRLARLPQGTAGECVVLAIAVSLYWVQEIAITHLSLDGGEATVRRALFFGTTAVLVLVAMHFRRFVGAWLIALGILMNVAPMAAHGGLMPVSYELIRDSGEFPEITADNVGRQVANSKDIVLEREDIRLEPLADRYLLELPAYGANIYSLGDFVAFAGLALVVVQGAFIVLGFELPRSRRLQLSSGA